MNDRFQLFISKIFPGHIYECTLRALLLIASVVVLSCEEKAALLKVGTWRGEFNVRGHSVPVTFDVSIDSVGETGIHFINGKERAYYSQITLQNDSLLIPLAIYDSYIIASVTNGNLSGFYRKNEGTTKGISFQADHGQNHRFETALSVPRTNLSGTWDVTITSDETLIKRWVFLIKLRMDLQEQL